MKLYAQHGAQAGQKIEDGFAQGFLDGVIFGPRDISLVNLKAELRDVEARFPAADRLFDPQYYSCLIATSDQSRVGNLPEDYGEYFFPRRRIDLVREEQIEQDIRSVLHFQTGLPLTHIIAPNVLISRSFDSREASIAVDFLRIAGRCYEEEGDTRPLLLTLAVSRDALIDRTALIDFVTEITGIIRNASGYYLLIAANSADARSEIFNREVIAGWMFLNYSLHLNGYSLINGYSDLLTPFLSAADGDAGASGWWANLRTFSLERFSPSVGGGRLPIPRYLSIALLNRITFHELDILRRLVPAVLNGLGTDDLYDTENGSEPLRNLEVLQSWDALRNLTRMVGSGNVETKLLRCRNLIKTAKETYQEAQLSVRFDQKSNDEHLQALEEGILSFAQLAELSLPTE